MWFRNILRNRFRRTEDQGTAHPGGEIFLSALALRQLDHLQLSAGRYVPGRAAGSRASSQRRTAYDFRDHRVYVPGDDTRYIDWKVSARHEHVFVRQGEQPKDISVFLLVDCSKSMIWGDPPKREAELRLAAALGYLALAHGDRLSLIPFNSTVLKPLGPISGKGQVPNLLNHLRSLPFEGGTNLTDAVKDFFQHIARGGLVFILSDFLELDDLGVLLARLPAPSWEVVLIQLLHPEEVDPQRKGNYEVVDVESGKAVNYDLDVRALSVYRERIRDWQQELERICSESNAFYTFIPTSLSLEKEVIAHLRAVHIVRPL